MNIEEIRKKLDISKEDVKLIYKRKRNQTIFMAIAPIAFIGFAMSSSVLGIRYGGINIEDFRIFRILRFLFGL